MKNNNEVKELYFMMNLHTLSKVVCLACEMELDKILSEKLTSIEYLASNFGYTYETLYRFFRVLDAYDIIKLVSKFHIKKGKLSPYLDRLRSPHLADSYNVISNLKCALKFNAECFSESYGKQFSAYIYEDQIKIDQFNSWKKKSAMEWLVPSILTIYNFSKFSTFYELGGDGYLLKEILNIKKNKEGTFLCNEEYLATANKIFNNFRTRVNIISGNLFDKSNLNIDAELYLFCRTFLSMSNDKILEILNNCCALLKKGSRIIIADFFIPDKSHMDYKMSTLADINTLACIGGLIRTKEEWLNLIKQSDIKQLNFYQALENISPTPILPMCVLEGII